jgi:hypothetical protein
MIEKSINDPNYTLKIFDHANFGGVGKNNQNCENSCDNHL